MIVRPDRLWAVARGIHTAVATLWTQPRPTTTVVHTREGGLVATARLFPSGDLEHIVHVARPTDPEALARAVARHRAKVSAAVTERSVRLSTLAAAPCLLVSPIWLAWAGLEAYIGDWHGLVDHLAEAWHAHSIADLDLPWWGEAAARVAWNGIRPVLVGFAVHRLGGWLLRKGLGWVGQRVMGQLAV